MSVRLAYRAYGEGPPLVILHGLFGSARNWHSAARLLARRYRVYALDLRNHGGSPWADTMTFADMTGDLERFLDDHGIGRPVLLGHSLGGKTAMLSALAHPERVEALIVVDIAPVAYDHSYLDYVRAMADLDLGRLSRRTDADAALAPAIPDPAIRGFLLQNVVVRHHRLGWRVNLDAIGWAMDDLLGFPEILAHEYDGRALFVSGERSDYIERAHHDAIFALFPQAEFAVVAAAGHRVHAEQPEGFLSAVEGFLDSAYA